MTDIVLIGIGGYGENYARLLLSEGAQHGARLAAGVDPFPERSAYFQAFRQAGIPVYPDLESFYRASTADLAVISTAIHLHAPLTCLALAHGSNVLVEKPLCASLEEARQMAQAQAESGRFVAVGYQWSFAAAIQDLKVSIQQGELGRPVRLKSRVLWPRSRAYFQRNTWAGRIQTEGGAWVLDSPAHNAAAHYLHNMLYVLGETRQASASIELLESVRRRANPIENFDTVALRGRTQQGAEVLFYAAHPVPEEDGPVLHYEFERAVVEYRAGLQEEFAARFHDGRLRSYGAPDLQDWTKLWQSIEAAQAGKDGRKLIALGIEGAVPQVACIQALHRAGEILPFPPERIRTQETGGDGLTFVEGLAEEMIRAYEENRMPGV